MHHDSNRRALAHQDIEWWWGGRRAQEGLSRAALLARNLVCRVVNFPGELMMMIYVVRLGANE